MRVDLPGGNWAELTAPDDLTEGQRRPLKVMFARVLRSAKQAGFELTGDSKDDQDALAEYADPELVVAAGDALVSAFVRDWSYDVGAPSGEAVLLLPATAYDALMGKLNELRGDALENDGPAAGPDSPFGSSSGSAPLSAVPGPIPAPTGVTGI